MHQFWKTMLTFLPSFVDSKVMNSKYVYFITLLYIILYFKKVNILYAYRFCQKALLEHIIEDILVCFDIGLFVISMKYSIRTSAYTICIICCRILVKHRNLRINYNYIILALRVRRGQYC